MISEEQQFSRLDTAFARFLGERTTFDPIQKQAFENLVMSVSYEQSQGHSCIRLDEQDRALALASGLAVSHSQAEACEQTTTLPLVVEQDRLYLHRYWFYEHRLAVQIKAMVRLSGTHGQKIADLSHSTV